MTKRTIRRAVGLAFSLALAPALAIAMPGQTVAQFTAWANGNSALHGLAKKTGEMSGLPYYTASFHAGSTAGTFLANVGEHDAIIDESVAVTTTQAYDILKHRDTASTMLTAVYGPGVSDDFAAAAKVGSWTLKDQTQQTALYRGKLYGYEVAFAWVKLIPVAGVAGEAKNLAACVTQECGD
jgi:hypothetical protein